ncbi:SDR family oxidoreductase [Roseinatronobacter monicus]|uniref:NADP-dependent 3-hydroxy acid dehydrogenase YdfG n=1 Tax=Roseinatronobacter monicus TaxID=393481 RepID=A0A543KEC5_9RHOB|nr:SDR family oxidoreductase [Roseinatronobacter monicus]TQM93377.1 NADP-dependent 3-hydroxy acid dehydrogenase YdfG [Roseinatronobacter monicus]
MRRTAIVTGAGSGIGRAVAVELAAQGWSVALTGRRHSALEGTAQAAQGDTLVHAADVTDPAAVAQVFEAVVAKWGRVDLLFNNAGIFPPAAPLEDLDLDTWRAAVDVNLNGAFYCLQAAFRVMKAQDPRGGRIINNGSISAHAPRPHSAPYTTTKHAMTGLTKSAALDGRAYGIAVGQIDIGNAASDMTQAMTQGVMQSDGTYRSEPVMDVGHVARAVAHMAALPPEANVLFTTIMATHMPFVGRG